MDILRIAAAALIYPGLLAALVAGLLYRLLAAGRPWTRLGLSAVATREGASALVGALFAGLALASLPWPLHPVAPGRAWLWAWAGFELAFLLPLLPALLSGAPALARAAIREAQLGVLARALLWAALAISLTSHDDWRGATLPAHLLALATALAALPPALGRGPFAAEVSVSPEGVAVGLPAAARALDEWTRDLRSGALVVAVLLAGLPVGVAPFWLALPMIAAGLIVVGLLLRRLDGSLPRLALPVALRLCAVWLMPLAVVASLALALAGRQ